ncbi:uncharacterized protein LOC118159362 isoform X2 [Oxyura jamaicensis]|uniref:uncharacterized protein LOC118159362 isoform X2 n=1 Tax=Oxyura jamaicensis TaxID=8884 RepID=UPI0015A6A3A5|nr:uncharacterized protein LOC118159362 isoform X2 [Oxyura jamaicensis]
MLRPAGYFAAFLCPFDRAAGGGCWRPHCQYLHEASRRPAAERCPCAVAGPSEGLSISSITKEDENAKQQLAKPTEVFPCEYQEGNSKVSPFRREFTKRSRNYSPVELEESDDECDLVINVPPLLFNKRQRKNRDYKNLNREEELDAVISAEELHGSAIADGPGYTAEKSEKIVDLQESGKCLNESEKARSVSLKANKIYLPDVNTETLKISEQRKRSACTLQKHKSASAEADVWKEILKQEKAESNILVKEFVEEYTASENCVGSGRVTQSVLCTSHSSEDETTIERPGKQVNTEKSRSTDKNGGNDSPQDIYLHPTDFLNVGKEACCGTVLQTKNTDKSSFVEPACRNKKDSEIIMSSSAEEMESSGEDPELSESDDPIEECRRIFEEFEREAQKKDSDKQTCGENVDASLLETEVNVAGQKRRIAHMAKFDVHNKNEMEPFEGSPVQQGPNNTRVQTAQLKAGELTASVGTDSGQKKCMSKWSAIQVQTSLNLLEVQPVETVSGQLRIPIEGNAEIVMPCRLSVGLFERTAVMPYEVL